MTTHTRSDEELLASFIQGDRTALAELALRYETSLLGLAMGITSGNRDLAMDAVQETWIRVIRHCRSFKSASTFKTWVYRITINQCRSLQSRRPEATSGSNDSTRTCESKCAEFFATSHERTVLLREAIAKLTAPKRTVLMLCYHAGMTHEQAAAILDIPTGTLKSRLNAALTELRALIPVEVNA